VDYSARAPDWQPARVKFVINLFRKDACQFYPDAAQFNNDQRKKCGENRLCHGLFRLLKWYRRCINVLLGCENADAGVSGQRL
jgi:hypothetical protein